MSNPRLQPRPGPLLRGRERECDGLATAIRESESRSLVLRGEAGIGKTALRKGFAKLDIRSREELANAMPDPAAQLASA